MTYWYWSTSSASESLDALARTLPSVVTDTLKVLRARITATLSWRSAATHSAHRQR
jgi:hypothetical protein